MNKKYTHHNNALTEKNIGSQVFLKGWVAKKRNLGGLVFIDLRDRFGITQLVVRPETKDYELASSLKSEYVIEAEGKVVVRESKNTQIATGSIEIEVSNLNILSVAATTPIIISEQDDSLEETRLKYRYLDLRKQSQQQYLIIRHHIAQAVRSVLCGEGFYELDTPILGKSTPEGARDYLVPSRLYAGQFYALPQSPQLYKQLFMIAGFEKYFQIAKCFRDEDLRADRQPEFTQIDIEASFIDQADIIELTEKLLAHIFKHVLNKKLILPIAQMTYFDALNKYGSDKPDLRYGLELKDYTNDFKHLSLFESSDLIKGILVDNTSLITRKKVDEYTALVKKNHGKMLAYLKQENGILSGSLAKLLPDYQLEEGKVLFLTGGTFSDVSQGLGALRKQLAVDLSLINEDLDALVWIVDWPLLEYNKEEQRFYAMHHPFTAPQDIEALKNNPELALAKAYDIVWNGYEAGGGSIRIHDQSVQRLMFETLGLSKFDIENRFGYFNEALQYGTPPHGGIALGLDRLVMLATRTNNIKDVIAFPKTQSAKDLMSNAPDTVDEKQLEELNIRSVKKNA